MDHLTLPIPEIMEPMLPGGILGLPKTDQVLKTKMAMREQVEWEGGPVRLSRLVPSQVRPAKEPTQ